MRAYTPGAYYSPPAYTSGNTERAYEWTGHKVITVSSPPANPPPAPVTPWQQFVTLWNQFVSEIGAWMAKL